MIRQMTFPELAAELGAKPPLLLIDSCCLNPEERTATAVKCVCINDPVFQGHFPGHPILPGVLQVVAMHQTAILLSRGIFPSAEAPVHLAALNRVKFRAPVEPGATMAISCKALEPKADGSCDFELRNTLPDGSVSSSATLTLSPVPLAAAPAGDEPFADRTPDSWVRGSAIEAMLPHRFPFLHLDGVSVAEAVEGPHVGYKCISGTDPCVHSAVPVAFPSPLQIEAGAQLGCAAMLSRPENRGKLGFFMSIDEAHFHHLALPGDKMFLNISIEQRGSFGIATGSILVRQTTIADAKIKFALVDGKETTN